MGELVMEGEIREVELSSIKPPRNVYRKVNQTKVRQLSESIKRFGLRHPITISSGMTLISGAHRLAAMRLLGKKMIRAEVIPAEGALARILTIEENLIRADLSELERGEHLKEHNKLLIELGERATQSTGGKSRTGKTKEKKEKKKLAQSSAVASPDDESSPDAESTVKTTKDIADELNLSERSLQILIQFADKIYEKARDKIRGTDIANNKSELLRLVKIESPEDQNIVVDMVLKGECKTIKEAVSKLTLSRQRADFAGRAAKVKKLPDNIKLVCKDFFEAEGDDKFLKHNSIDAIITDPPYVDGWKENWAPFLNIAADILKPGGFLISYVGHIRLPEFFEALKETQINAETGGAGKNNQLKFFWICALDHSGSIKAVHPFHVQCGFKPIIIAYKPTDKNTIPKPYKYFNDLIPGSGREKGLHSWQQSANELVPLIDTFTAPGDIILDPFMGSGTTGVACKMTARKFTGYDIVKENVDIAIKQISDTEPDV
jgi:hypothetical protein